MSGEVSETAQRRARELSGPEKASAIILAMGKAPAARVLKHLEPPDLRAVARAATKLGVIPQSLLEKLTEEFSKDFSEGASLLGDAAHVKGILSDVLPPEQATAILNDALGEEAGDDLWQAIARLPESALISFLAKERPAVVSYVLSKLDSARAARIVARLPLSKRNAALCSLISPSAVSQLAAEAIERSLRESLMKAGAASEGSDARTRMAAIINCLEPSEADDVMQTLGRMRPQEAAALKPLLFSFNDLPRLSERARALLLDKAPSDVVVLALRGVDAAFRDAVLTPMPARARRLVEGELAAPSHASLRDIAKARRRIVEIVLAMAVRGEIELQPPDAADTAEAA